MSKLLTVFGATGRQGGSVIDAVSNDRILNQQYKIRGIARDSSKDNYLSLKQRGVEVVEADANNKSSLANALDGSHAVFIVTTTIFDGQAMEREIAQGRAMADAAVASGAELLIFSSLPNASQISWGKYRHVYHFDAKAEIEAYIRTLPIKSVFIAMGSYMQDLHEGLAPRPMGDGTYAIVNCFALHTQFPFVDAHDTGKWVGAVLLEPQRFISKSVAAGTRIYCMEDTVNILTEVLGQVVKYQEVTEAEVRGFIPDTLAVLADGRVDMAFYFQDFGYFGPTMKALVKSGSTQARGNLTTLEEYLSREPPRLH
ncbi:putative NmrA-like domain-containing protein [Seiridium unicorne]|uniref:NmrA-like domain-containing protein n=1 Tax=Seiridium unicorne TaxID=138068 RepID=A0ABR2UWB7_9PEZI